MASDLTKKPAFSFEFVEKDLRNQIDISRNVVAEISRLDKLLSKIKDEKTKKELILVISNLSSTVDRRPSCRA